MQLSLRREVQTRFNTSLSFPPSSPLSRLFDYEVRYEYPRDDDPSCPRPSYDDGRLCSSFLLVTCVPCLPYVIQNQSGDSRLGEEIGRRSMTGKFYG